MAKASNAVRLSFGAVTLAAAVLSIGAAPPAGAPKIDPKLWAKLCYRHIGPIGNRVIAVAGVPGNGNIAYIGAASGGLFKTIDGGTRWEPIFDEQPASSVSALVIAPSDPNVIWAGTGETFIRSNISIGNGIYKSTDAGKSWTHMGLERVRKQLADFPPTAQQREVHALYERQIAEHRKQFDDFIAKDLVAFNAMAREKGVAGVVMLVP